MAALETVELEHLPATHTVLLALYRNVANTAFLQEQLLSRNADFEYAFVDASTVASRFQLLSAVYKAIAAEMAGSMRTPNVHSEVVVSLNSNNNISEAYRRYGVQPSTKDVVVVKVLISREGSPSSLSPEDVGKHLQTHVQGESVSCSDEELAKVTDWPKLRKYHKLNGLPWIEAIKDEKAKKNELEMLIISAMAMRGT
ncbi:EKC/KEOPS complex subunit [Apiospora phragmitis]|uniref:EKC/KEOPS complex subunit CGI121 n=1 Tax=Apiospora phragmitis TaxID=2905665 RepID=A0ABR1UGJ9_9PEZI